VKKVKELFDELVKEFEEGPEESFEAPTQEEKPEPPKPEQTNVIQSIRNKLQKPVKKQEETPAPEPAVQIKYEYTIPQDCLDDIVNL